MAVLNVVLSAPLARKASPHATIALLAVLGSYVYRDIWPLVTFDLRPIDETTPLLWIKIVLALLGGVLLPVFEPHAYIPVDPLNPQKEVNPEQTASIFSFVFFFFLDRVIRKGSSLKPTDFPPICDFDSADNLAKRSYGHLDLFSGAPKGRSLFWGLTRIFRSTLGWQSVCLLTNAASKIASPYATLRLLTYLETGGVGQHIKPWFWLIWLAIAPIISTLSLQLYLYFSVRDPL
jgi:hypothetical protein